MESRWRMEPHIRTRRLGRKALAYHTGSGDTHLLNAVSGDILECLSGHAERGGCSLASLAGEASGGLSEDEVRDTLMALAEAGIVRCESTQ